MTNDNKIKDQVLKAIQSGRVAMRPRWHFVARTALLIVGTVLALLTLLYLASFIFFILRENRLWMAPGFGFRGIGAFIWSLPWLLVVLSLLFIVLLEIMVRKYSFSYRKPLLYSSLGIIGLVVIGGFGLEETKFHRSLYEQARQNHLPFAGSLYRQYGMPNMDNVIDGEIEELIESGYRIETRRDEELEVMIDDDTDFPQGRELRIGDTIFVVGERQDENTIQAFGIRKISPGGFHPKPFDFQMVPPR